MRILTTVITMMKIKMRKAGGEREAPWVASSPPSLNDHNVITIKSMSAYTRGRRRKQQGGATAPRPAKGPVT